MKLKCLNRFRIKEDRNIQNDLCLNRAERVERWSGNIIKDLRNIDISNIGNYYDIDDLHEKLSSYLEINKMNILITNGADEAIRTIYNLYAEPNSNIMFPYPTYGMYQVYTEMYKCNKITLEYDNFKLNKKKMYENLKITKIFFLPNPNHSEDNLEKDEIEKICNILIQNNGIMVVDETYYGFGSNTVINLLDKCKNLYIIRSFSKSWGLPGIRIGCLISKAYSISNIRQGYEISYLSYKLCMYFFNNISLIENYIKRCIDGRKFLQKYLNSINIQYNGETGYIFNIIFNNEKESKHIHKTLKENKIHVRLFQNTIGLTICPIEYIQKFLKIFISIYNKMKNNVLEEKGAIIINNLIEKKYITDISKVISSANNIVNEPYSNHPYRCIIEDPTILFNIDPNLENNIQKIIKTYLNDDYTIYSITGHFKDKWVGAEEHWHQDYSYNMLTHNGNPYDFYRIFIAIDDHTDSNGSMMFMEGSHKENHLEYNSMLSIHSHEKKRTDTKILDKVYKKYNIKNYNLNKGDCILFNSLILHSSHSNQTPLSRKAIQIQLIKKNTQKYSNDIINKHKKDRKNFEIQSLENIIKNKNNI